MADRAFFSLTAGVNPSFDVAADAGYARAIEVARERGVQIPMQ